ncbi:hypothetical protein O0S10_09400 [Methanocorpusculum sp. MG]|uniref:Uncharacterized protein n=1 Tax=Methanocorpusculum petauri TaxID=3002863 RepID=A0ABT4II70_9EURY|nr:hypothetical protein [Methanocorpusculum petauri]MCZ0861430.1 hypothetical protein [Methanocorpusculum petauri]
MNWLFPLFLLFLVLTAVTSGCVGTPAGENTSTPYYLDPPDPFIINRTADPFAIPDLTIPVNNMTPYQKNIDGYTRVTGYTPAGLFAVTGSIPENAEELRLNFVIFGEQHTVSLQNLHSRLSGYAAYVGYLDNADPATAFILSIDEGNQFSTFIGWKNMSLSIIPITDDDQPVHLVSLLTAGANDPVPLGPNEVRLTQKSVSLGCPTGETFIVINETDFIRYPELLRLYTAPEKTAIISDQPVRGYDVFISPEKAEEIFAVYGTRPADGFYQTYPWVHKFLAINGTNYFLEKGGIGLANYIYGN